MSIPRLAIERPITMFMLSAVVILIGGLSLARLPVDLMPDVSFPSITVRVGYAGVGPLEMEELVTRPIEQALSAVAGLERLESTSSEGSARVTLNLAWGTDLNEAADDIRNRLDRVRGRLPEEADAPVMFKFDASAAPIMGVGVEGDYDRVTAARDRRARPVAAPRARARRRRGHRRRRPAPSDSRRALEGEDPRARPAGRSRRQPAAHREPEHPARRNRRGRSHLPRPQPGPVREPERDPRPGRDDATRACPSTCATSPRSRTRPRTSARSRASTASPASGCASPSSPAPTRSRSPTRCAPKSPRSTARCRA